MVIPCERAPHSMCIERAVLSTLVVVYATCILSCSFSQDQLEIGGFTKASKAAEAAKKAEQRAEAEFGKAALGARVLGRRLTGRGGKEAHSSEVSDGAFRK